MTKTLSGKRAGQHDEELLPFIDLLNQLGVRSYLEIGARQGDTFARIMLGLPPGSKGTAVDLPGAPWGKEGTDRFLEASVRWVQQNGREATAVIGDCRDPDRLKEIDALGPYDAIFIDADHRYESVKADFELYRDRAVKCLAFHDINGHGVVQPSQQLEVGVPQLWAEIKDSIEDLPIKVTPVEFIRANPERPMGIGVLIFEPDTSPPAKPELVKCTACGLELKTEIVDGESRIPEHHTPMGKPCDRGQVDDGPDPDTGV